MFRNYLSQSEPLGDTTMKTGWVGCMTQRQRMKQSLADLKAARGATPSMAIVVALALHTCLIRSAIVLQSLRTAGLYIGRAIGNDIMVKRWLVVNASNPGFETRALRETGPAIAAQMISAK